MRKVTVMVIVIPPVGQSKAVAWFEELFVEFVDCVTDMIGMVWPPVGPVSWQCCDAFPLWPILRDQLHDL